MFLFNLKIAYQNLIRNKGYSFINIFGLAIGMACTILLLLWVNHEMSFDKFHKKDKQLFQIVNWQTYSGQEYGWGSIPGKLVDALKEEIPEIVRGTNYNGWGDNSLVFINGIKNYEKVMHADADFFQMFSFPLLKGSPDKVFEDPFSLVISEKMAKKYFGDKDPIGQVVQFDTKYDLTITGVLKNLPSNSNFKFDFIAPFKFKKKTYNGWKYWGNHSFFGFVELDVNANRDKVNAKLNSFYKDHVDKESTERITLFPVSETHLYSLEGEETGMKQIKVFLIIALFILLIACFNFMNLSTARASKRAKEIGIKKAVGSSKSKLIKQFLFESILLSFIAINFALMIVRVFLPEFNTILARSLTLDYINGTFLAIVFSVVIITGLLAGIYPAFFLTSYKTVDVIKGVTNSGNKGVNFRKVLVVFQFTLTVVLLISTLTISLQTKFLKNTSTGLNKSNVVFVNLNGNMKKMRESIKEELSRDPSIIASSFSSFLPIGIHNNGSGHEWNNDESSKEVLITRLYTDFDFVNVFKTPMLEGRFYSKNHLKTDSNKLVINETLARLIGKGSVLNKTIKQGNESKQIIGVIKDFNFQSLHARIAPLMIFNEVNYGVLTIRIAPNTTSRALTHIEKVCQKYNPDFPAVINFLENRYETQYRKEDSTIAILKYFTILTILISCLGLFGLASFMAEEKTKEIGVRKVLGATVYNLVALFSKEFTKWVILANIIAWPIAWYIMDYYLSKYAFHIDMPWWVFIVVGLLVLGISVLTVAYQSWKSANQDPVKSLKYE
ncbi:ABC transporter permease [Ancylomarina sp. DW003]|nr:ABC transporter permease [Ancylomarina sp. DW003]MDE5421338.1 ABC transporter permease [Ancylomarina sp. DW003]